jgi:hypothetical protein
MKKLFLLCILALLIISGCHVQDRWPKRQDPAALSDLDQYKAAQNAFQEKLAAAPGLNLAELRARWGHVRQSMTLNQSTIYRWVRTISVTPPPEAAGKLGLTVPPAEADGTTPALALSCMAIFIVNQKGVVEEANSEGRCLDPGLMPGWRPVVAAAGG